MNHKKGLLSYNPYHHTSRPLQRRQFCFCKGYGWFSWAGLLQRWWLSLNLIWIILLSRPCKADGHVWQCKFSKFSSWAGLAKRKAKFIKFFFKCYGSPSWASLAKRTVKFDNLFCQCSRSSSKAGLAKRMVMFNNANFPDPPPELVLQRESQVHSILFQRLRIIILSQTCKEDGRVW